MAVDIMLTERLWCLLDSLVDGQQEFEQVYADYAARSPSTTHEDLLADLAFLRAIGLVSVHEFSAPPAEAQGVPGPVALPGSTIEMTSLGASEWEDSRYEAYWTESTPPPPESVTIPFGFQYGVAGLCLLLAMVGIWGYLQATWSMASDKAVDLGQCLRPMRATLAAAGAPASVLVQLDKAGQAGIWRSEAGARLQEVNASLSSMHADSVVAAVQTKVQRLMNACRPDSPCECGALGR
jgi:hypothetical protein